jgi:hypothetical protein
VASQLIGDGARFVHVHTKVTDEAAARSSHARSSRCSKRSTRLAGLEALADRAIVAITGDHATPSVDSVLHTSDPTPLLSSGRPCVPTRSLSSASDMLVKVGNGVVRAHELLRCFRARESSDVPGSSYDTATDAGFTGRSRSHATYVIRMEPPIAFRRRRVLRLVWCARLHRVSARRQGSLFRRPANRAHSHVNRYIQETHRRLKALVTTEISVVVRFAGRKSDHGVRRATAVRHNEQGEPAFRGAPT